jgi:hypothetical protein
MNTLHIIKIYICKHWTIIFKIIVSSKLKRMFFALFFIFLKLDGKKIDKFINLNDFCNTKLKHYVITSFQSNRQPHFCESRS